MVTIRNAQTGEIVKGNLEKVDALLAIASELTVDIDEALFFAVIATMLDQFAANQGKDGAYMIEMLDHLKEIAGDVHEKMGMPEAIKVA